MVDLTYGASGAPGVPVFNHRLALGLLTLSGVTLAGLTSLSAQTSNQTFITITTSPPGGRFLVDGQPYTSSAVISWLNGSTHVIQALSDPIPKSYDPTIIATRPYLQSLPPCYREFGGWTDTSGQIIDNGASTVSVTADPGMTSLVINYAEYCMVYLDLNGEDPPAYPNTCDNNATLPEGTPTPAGIVFVQGGLSHQCFWNNAAEYVQVPTALTLSVYATPGWVFQQWDLPDLTLKGPIVTALVNDENMILPWTPEFVPAERVRFLTTPPGLNVVVDHEMIPTIREPGATVFSQCAAGEKYPPPVSPFPTAIPQMCIGDFDWLIGSTHTAVVPSPQTDDQGHVWVFGSWTGTVAPAGSYTVPSQPDLETANFIPAAQISWATIPSGLRLTVDGVSTHAGAAIWAVNTVHSLSAPMQQRDVNNKVWDFQSWSDGGSATHSYAVPAAAVNGGLLVYATYVYDPAASANNLLTVTSSPSGLVLQVNGQSCVTPCTTSQPTGTKVTISAPPMLTPAPGTQYTFQNWSDLGAPSHPVTLNNDVTVLANYTTRYQLTAAASPAGAGTFTASPQSSDGYYAAGTLVSLTEAPSSGYRFSSWNGGGLSGSAPTATLSMQAPMQVTGYFQKQQDTPGVFVQNAAGVTPQPAVATGSLIAIYGPNLAPGTQTGPTDPLAQTLQGVVVTSGDRILPLMYVSPTQINAFVPSGLSPGNYDLTISSSGQRDILTSYTVARNAPGLLVNLSGNRHYALALHQDGSLITPLSPALPGETVTILGTGFGPLTLPYIDGFPAPQLPANPLVDPVSLSLGGTPLTPSWAGAAPGYVGLDAVQFPITSAVPAGATLDLTVTVNGVSSNTVQLPIQ